jgi:hypothetical protein
MLLFMIDLCMYPVCLPVSTALVDLGRLFSILIYTQSVGLLGHRISPSQGRCLHTEQHKHRINARKHPCLEWDSNLTIPAFERAKTIHFLDRAATVIGVYVSARSKLRT